MTKFLNILFAIAYILFSVFLTFQFYKGGELFSTPVVLLPIYALILCFLHLYLISKPLTFRHKVLLISTILFFVVLLYLYIFTKTCVDANCLAGVAPLFGSIILTLICLVSGFLAFSEALRISKQSKF